MVEIFKRTSPRIRGETLLGWGAEGSSPALQVYRLDVARSCRHATINRRLYVLVSSRPGPWASWECPSVLRGLRLLTTAARHDVRRGVAEHADVVAGVHRLLPSLLSIAY